MTRIRRLSMRNAIHRGDMRNETVDDASCGQLAARVPAPGGGATAALHAAQAAALVAMVAPLQRRPPIRRTR